MISAEDWAETVEPQVKRHYWLGTHFKLPPGSGYHLIYHWIDEELLERIVKAKALNSL